MNKITSRFLELFYKIAQIPRESGRENKFANFLESFAKENNLECYRDENNNVLIKKSGNKANNETVILQAHMDMVCVKKDNSNHNFEVDPIKIVRNGDVISAYDTSLGADQGIGLAIMLLILESREIKHPDLECLFTTEEETTFNGAIKFDYSRLSGKSLINLDHCRDDSIIIGSDADICNKYTFKCNLNTSDMPTYEINIDGIRGGNSGVEIERSSRNAIVIIAEIIKELQQEHIVLIHSIDGGTSENDIATECKCIIKTNIDNIEDKIKKLNRNVKVSKAISNSAFSIEDSRKIINEIIGLNQGSIKAEYNNIIVSGNVGIINTVKNEIIIKGVLRSIELKELEKYNKENIILSESNGFIVEEIYRDSAWTPNENSKLKEDYKNIYYQVNGEYPNLEITHGGLEVSSIKKRMNNIDIISIGSIIEDSHTVNERMYISSCEKTIQTLLSYLKYDN